MRHGLQEQLADASPIAAAGAQSFSPRYWAEKAPSPLAGTDLATRRTGNGVHESHGVAASLELSSGTTVSSISLDPLEDDRTVSDIPGLPAPLAPHNRGEVVHQEELWTQGVDPANVAICKDSAGQAKVLGWGRFAISYWGTWRDTQVAVKVMLASNSVKAQRKVRAHTDSLGRLRHPNIVSLMGVCISPGEEV
jgi:hypothetical protein